QLRVVCEPDEHVVAAPGQVHVHVDYFLQQSLTPGWSLNTCCCIIPSVMAAKDLPVKQASTNRPEPTNRDGSIDKTIYSDEHGTDQTGNTKCETGNGY